MFDSDFDSSDIGSEDDIGSADISDSQDSDDIEFLDTSDAPASDDIEFLDTFDLEMDASDSIQNDINDSSDNLDDTYHAARLSEEELHQIDDLWKDDTPIDTEPYQAAQQSNIDLIEDKEPYRATKNVDFSDDDISDEFADLADMEAAGTTVEQFTEDVESMSFEDLEKEQKRIDELSHMDDMDIFAQYDAERRVQIDPELFDSLTYGLSKESLEYLKTGLESGNPEVYDYFGLNEDVDDEDGASEMELVRRRR